MHILMRYFFGLTNTRLILNPKRKIVNVIRKGNQKRRNVLLELFAAEVLTCLKVPIKKMKVQSWSISECLLLEGGGTEEEIGYVFLPNVTRKD